MRPLTSLYLDAVRLGAALTVFLGHLSGARFTGGFLWQCAPFMQDAVTVFFILSGFVIAFATDNPRQTAGSFAVARAARIASVALPALLLTFTLDMIGSYLRADLYSPAWGYAADAKLWQYVSSLLFLNHVWFWQTGTGSNLPYWSLSFECWYYVLFGLAVFAPVRYRLIAVTGGLGLVGPQIAAAFPLWLFGVVGFHSCKSRQIARAGGCILALATSFAGVAYLAWGRDLFPTAWFPALTLGPGSLPRAYLVGALFTVHLIGIDAAFAGLSCPVAVARPIRWLAGATFSIYLFHMPIAQFITMLVPWAPASLSGRIVVLGGTLVAVLLLAEITERRKEAWRCRINAALNRGSSLPIARPS